MNNILNTIDKIYEDIKSDRNFEKHQNLVITGNNSSGKTKLIKQILVKAMKYSPGMIYYIAAKNRNIVESSDSGSGLIFKDLDQQEVIRIRLKDELSGQDLFTEMDRGSSVAFFEILNNVDKYNELFTEFFGISISKNEDFDKMLSGAITIKINEDYDITKVSTSEAAQMRILMEVNYAYESGFKAIIIDEFDAFFELNNLKKFMYRLLERYQMRFIFIIQSLEILVQLSDIDVAMISEGINNTVDENRVTFIDVDDVTQIGQVQRLKSSLISTTNIEENNLEYGVSCIVKGGHLDEQYMIELNKIDRSKLKTKEKILYDYIIGYIKKNETFFSNKI